MTPPQTFNALIPPLGARGLQRRNRVRKRGDAIMHAAPKVAKKRVIAVGNLGEVRDDRGGVCAMAHGAGLAIISPGRLLGEGRPDALRNDKPEYQIEFEGEVSEALQQSLESEGATVLMGSIKLETSLVAEIQRLPLLLQK